jgi:hypothetical protein
LDGTDGIDGIDGWEIHGVFLFFSGIHDLSKWDMNGIVGD